MKSIIRCVETVRPPMLTRDRDTPEIKKVLAFKHARKFTPLLVASVALHRSRLICETTHVNIILLRNYCSFASSIILDFLAFQVEDLF
jgi:hypothetical protein